MSEDMCGDESEDMTNKIDEDEKSEKVCEDSNYVTMTRRGREDTGRRLIYTGDYEEGMRLNGRDYTGNT